MSEVETAPSQTAYWLGLLRDWALAGVVVIAAFATFQWIANPAPLSHGPAPAFALNDLRGGEVNLDQFADKTVVLNFWFSDCLPCRDEIPELTKWVLDHPDTPLIGISTDRMQPEELVTRVRQLGINYRVGHDIYARTSEAYGVRVFPTTMVVKNGEIRAVRVGSVNRISLDALVASAE